MKNFTIAVITEMLQTKTLAHPDWKKLGEQAIQGRLEGLNPCYNANCELIRTYATGIFFM
jgi:hypothetical protein